jgi:hypothetical protein
MKSSQTPVLQADKLTEIFAITDKWQLGRYQEQP